MRRPPPAHVEGCTCPRCAVHILEGRTVLPPSLVFACHHVTKLGAGARYVGRALVVAKDAHARALVTCPECRRRYKLAARKKAP